MLMATHLIGFGVGAAGTTQTIVAQGTGTPLGSMTGGGGLAAAFDGTTSQGASSCAAFGASTGGNIGKDWGAGNTKKISRVRFWTPNNARIDGGAGNETITAQLRGSTDNFSSSNVLIEEWSGLLNSTDPQEFDQSTLNFGTGYRYHRVDFSHTGGADTRIAEVIFYEEI